MTNPWIDVCAAEEIPAGGAKLVRAEGNAIALWRTDAGALHAVDNRCPHEGYPLVKGELRDCALTCSWHNYKFDLRDGSCLVGEEGVRVFPLREEAGRVLLDLTPPDPSLERDKLWKSLEEGAVEGDMGRSARDLARLMELEVEPQRLLQEIVAHDADRGKYGVTHVLAVAADLRDRMRRYPDEYTLGPILHAYELFAEGSRRRPRHPDPAPAAEASRTHFLEAVEREDLPAAAGILATALREHRFDTVQEWLLLAAASHFLGFGHGLIYATKLGEIAGDAPPAHRARMAQGLLRQIVFATREDVLPPMATTREWLHGNYEQRKLWAAAPGSTPLSQDEHAALVNEILGGTAKSSCAELDRHLAAGIAPDSLCDALVHAAAERLWRFDPDIHDDITTQDGWLHVSHPLTFAHAIREAIAWLPHAITLGALYHGAHFIQRARKLDGEWVEAPGKSAAPLDEGKLAQALRGGQVDAALDAAAGSVDTPEGRAALRQAVDSLVLADVATRPIYIAHVLKTTRVAFEEAESLPAEAARISLFALLRFLSSPKNERVLRRLAYEAQGLVESGRLPRLLSA